MKYKRILILVIYIVLNTLLALNSYAIDKEQNDKTCAERFGQDACNTKPCEPNQICFNNKNPESCFTCRCKICDSGFYLADEKNCECKKCTKSCGKYEVYSHNCSCVCKGEPKGGCPNNGLWNHSLCTCVDKEIDSE